LKRVNLQLPDQQYIASPPGNGGRGLKLDLNNPTRHRCVHRLPETEGVD